MACIFARHLKDRTQSKKTESFSAVSAANGGAKIFVPNFSVSGCDLFFSL